MRIGVIDMVTKHFEGKLPVGQKVVDQKTSNFHYLVGMDSLGSES
jgi:hypothetical protein